MATPTKIIVKKKSVGVRLDVFLAEKLSAQGGSALGGKTSRSQIQKLIAENGILLNGELPKKSGEAMAEGDIITIIKEKIKPATTKQKTAEVQKLPPLKILAETPDYLVIEKPVGLLTHPTMKKETASVSSILVNQFPELKKVGDLPAGRQATSMRPGIVHRLDKDASGLLVIARTQKMFDYLKEQFKTRKIGKEYLALAHGKVAKDWDEINFPIARGKNAERMAAIPIHYRGEKTETGKEALTEFMVEKRFVNFTLLKVKIHTGRMHQIRVHLLAYNHPLVGDPLYFQKKRKKMWDAKLGRLFLHCTKLVFKDLNEQEQTFISPLPSELEKFLKILK